MEILTKKILKADEAGAAELKNIMEEVTAHYQRSHDSSKTYTLSYQKFREVVRYFTAKKGSTRVAHLEISGIEGRKLYEIIVKNEAGDDIMDACFTS